jgi:hypothetical protein
MRTVVYICCLLVCSTLYDINQIIYSFDKETTNYLGLLFCFFLAMDFIELFKITNKENVKKDSNKENKE